jgi:hypothetical protein
MKILERGAFRLLASWCRNASAVVLAVVMLFAAAPFDTRAAQDQDQPAPAPASQGPAYETQSPEQLQQLVAPIALYPDSLVAQILSASTFPEQVVEADRWVQNHQDLKGDALAQAVDKEPWDPSVKALAAFPAVLGNMDKNLSWTSSLGDAYYNQQQDVADAIQVMRQKAQQAGNLSTTQQQTVTTQGSTIIIQPAAPDVVYVPAYDPWLVYGPGIVAWPGWYPYPGIWYGGPHLFFGVGFGIGFFGGFGWGWGHWGYDWHNHYAVYNHERYFSHSTTFYNRNAYYPALPAGKVSVRKTEASPPTAMSTTGRAPRPGRSRETTTLHEGSPNLIVRATCTPAHSAAMTMVENHAAIQPAAAPASAAVDFTAVVEAARTVAATTSPGLIGSAKIPRFERGGKCYAGWEHEPSRC